MMSATAVGPVGVELELHEVRVGVLHEQLVDGVVAEALELLEVVVVEELHVPVGGDATDGVEELRTALDELDVAIRVELDVASDSAVADLLLELED